MLYILIPVAWLAIAIVLLAACRMAAMGDGTLARCRKRMGTDLDQGRAHQLFNGLVVWEDPAELQPALAPGLARAGRPALQGSPLSSRRRPIAHGGRRHGARSSIGS
jgi:hypothetical protein